MYRVRGQTLHGAQAEFDNLVQQGVSVDSMETYLAIIEHRVVQVWGPCCTLLPKRRANIQALQSIATECTARPSCCCT